MIELQPLAIALVAPLALLLLGGWGAGVAVLGARFRPGAATTLLAGWLALASVMASAGAAGLPRDAVLALGAALTLFGLVRVAMGRRPRSEAPDAPSATSDDVATVGPGPSGLARALASALLPWAPAVLLVVPLLLAATTPPLRYDAVTIWWPKLLEVAAGHPPSLDVTTVHFHAEYPRGLAWLLTAAAPWGWPDPRLLKLQSWLFTAATAAAMVEAGRAVGRRRTGLAAGGLYALLPQVALWSHAGYADPAVGAAVLLAGLGLARRGARTPGRFADGAAAAAAPAEHAAVAGDAAAAGKATPAANAAARLAVVAAVGAASIKQEGAVLVPLVGLVLLSDAWTPRRVRGALAFLALGLVVLLPWWWRRAGGPSEVLGSAGTVLLDPLRLAARLSAVAEGAWLFLTDRGALVDGQLQPPVAWTAWLVLASLVVLLPRGPRRFDARPAAVLLGAVLVVYVVTPFDLHWHLRTAFPRLLLQALPLLLLASVDRLVGPAPPSGSGRLEIVTGAH